MDDPPYQQLVLASAADPSPEKPRCILFKLPPEIREMIYDSLVIEDLDKQNHETSFMGLFWSCKEVCSDFRLITLKARPLLFASSTWNHTFMYSMVPDRTSIDTIYPMPLRFRITPKFFTAKRSDLEFIFLTPAVAKLHHKYNNMKREARNPFVHAVSRVLQLPWATVTIKGQCKDGSIRTAYQFLEMFMDDFFDEIKVRNMYDKRYFCQTNRLVVAYSTETEYPPDYVTTLSPRYHGLNKWRKYRNLAGLFLNNLVNWNANLPTVECGWLCCGPISRPKCPPSKTDGFEIEFEVVYDFETGLQFPGGAVWEVFRHQQIGGQKWLVRPMVGTEEWPFWQEWREAGGTFGPGDPSGRRNRLFGGLNVTCPPPSVCRKSCLHGSQVAQTQRKAVPVS